MIYLLKCVGNTELRSQNKHVSSDYATRPSAMPGRDKHFQARHSSRRSPGSHEHSMRMAKDEAKPAPLDEDFVRITFQSQPSYQKAT